MLNSLETYAEAGTRAAEAQNVGDAACVRHWREFFHRMLALEKRHDKGAANDAYNRAYARARRNRDGTPMVAYRVSW